MKLAFDLLFDAGNKVADAYGIAMQLPDDLIKVYASAGIDLPKFDVKSRRWVLHVYTFLFGLGCCLADSGASMEYCCAVEMGWF